MKNVSSPGRRPSRTRSVVRPLGSLVVGVLVAAGVVAGPSVALPSGPVDPAADPSLSAPAVTESACARPTSGDARCLAEGRVDSTTRRAAASATRSAGLARATSGLGTLAATATKPPGYGAGDLRAAYRLPAGTSRATVAVVIAGDVPTAEADLAVYRATYKLPACTSASGCFRKVNQRGAKAPLPQADPGWALEGSLDLQMVSTGCPTCRILLVEGDDPSFEALAAATDTARRLGATVTSHSYGADENAFALQFSRSYRASGMLNVVSSGDFGFTIASYPAVLSQVLAVGGTSLRRNATAARGWTEKVWSGAGSGCSAYVAKPWFQHDGHCAMRTVADLSAVADPQTGVAVYDSWESPFSTEPGWYVLGGTSASAPLVAGMVGAAGTGTTFRNANAYQRTRFVNDVVGGTNGVCGGDYLCRGLAGYDAPSGIGTPNGLRVFTG
ncbi:S53 family peptidase [Phycicoccus sonneratiae]|uniref:Peptidase S53 domain-containing protein n=1 Tax=Phycicoccus sonneratiae TaxID=2807628 RepID=A0ABS2CPE5_9MICO|nr:S8 family serine peptidase [Phycicoccus sonneraticus]MBM6401665.1 hypothetical protein [Phycicoccus sonneraticus]